MLKALLGTLILIIILVFFLLSKHDKVADKLPVNIKTQRQSAVQSTNDLPNLVKEQGNKEKIQVRNITSEEVMRDFYKESSALIVKKAKDEAQFLSKYQRVSSNYYDRVQEEKWSIFPEVYITMDKNSGTLLPFGPYKITDKPTADMPVARLIYNEDQKTFSILTGRLIAKLKNLFDDERISKDYDLRIDSVNADIRTVFYRMNGQGSLSDMRKLLHLDSRVDSFYFETVHNQWQKN